MALRLACALVWMGLLLPSSNALPAQDIAKASTIMIDVKDESGAPAPNAQIQILPVPNTFAKVQMTGTDGKLLISVPPGSYELQVSLRGFLPYGKQIEVLSDKSQTVAVVLRVGSCPPGPCGIVTNVFPVSFPERSQAVSPDGRYVIVGVDSDAEPFHTVFLEDRALKTRRKLFDYDRHVSFLWHYDSKVFAITDYVGSDSSQCTIFSVDVKVAPIQVLDVLFRQLSQDSRESLVRHLSNHHVFVEASVWVKPMDLQLRISDYGSADPKGFTETFSLHVPPGTP